MTPGKSSASFSRRATHGAAALAEPITDTLKRADANYVVAASIDAGNFMRCRHRKFSREIFSWTLIAAVAAEALRSRTKSRRSASRTRTCFSSRTTEFELQDHLSARSASGGFCFARANQRPDFAKTNRAVRIFRHDSGESAQRPARLPCFVGPAVTKIALSSRTCKSSPFFQIQASEL